MFPESITPSLLLDLAWVRDGEQPEEWLERLTEVAVTFIPACDLASVTSAQDDGFVTVAVSNETAGLLDQGQYLDGAGPCLAACRSADLVRLDPASLDDATVFARSADELGVVDVLSVPLSGPGDARRSLNCYSQWAKFGGIDETAAWVLAALGTAATRTIGEAERYAGLVESVESALGRRDIIGQAKGILMQSRAIGPDEAFELLRSTSQTNNLKLADVAAQVAQTGRLEP